MRKKGVKEYKDAIDGAKDIISEEISDNAEYRKWMRMFIKELAL